MNRYIPVFLCALLSLAGSTARAGPTDHKHLIELFTSQSCYSCPPADEVFGRLIHTRSDVVGLEFHVDYWNDLPYGGAGTWVDPFSEKDYSQRQQRYEARGLAGNNGVYTPQAVVNGRTAVVGSDEGTLDTLLAGKAPRAVDLVVTRGPASVKVAVSGQVDGPGEVWLYEFDVRKVTRIGGGENHGKTLTNHNIVRDARRLGVWKGNTQVYSTDKLKLDDGQGCAIVVQRPGQGPVLGADLCPS